MTRRRASMAFAVGRDMVFAVVACAAALFVSLTIQLDMTERELRDTSLEAAARNIALHLKADADGPARLVDRPGAGWTGAGYPTVVFDRDGRVIYQQPHDLDPALIAALAEQRRVAPEQLHRLGAIRFFTLTPDRRRISGAALHAGSGNDSRVVVVFKNESAADALVDDIVRRFPYRSAQVLLPLFALLLAASAWIVRRRMRPIAEVSAIAGTIGPYTLNVRLPERDLPAELLPIVRAINDVFARLQRGAEAQHEFLRHAAHQLRTPMMLLSARAASLDQSETAEMIRADVKGLARIVSQLLQLSELDALPDSGQRLADLGAVAEAVRDELCPTALRQGNSIALARPDAPVLVHGDPNIIEVAVRNLVENALQYSPAAARIELRVATAGSLEVVDFGPGVPEAMRDHIFEPFWSGGIDGTRAGLGLTIVRRIARRYGATVSVGSSAGAGAVFALRFPKAPTSESALDPGAIEAAAPASLARGRRRAA